MPLEAAPAPWFVYVLFVLPWLILGVILIGAIATIVWYFYHYRKQPIVFVAGAFVLVFLGFVGYMGLSERFENSQRQESLASQGWVEHGAGKFTFWLPDDWQNLTEAEQPYYHLPNVVAAFSHEDNYYRPMNYSQDSWVAISSEDYEYLDTESCLNPGLGDASMIADGGVEIDGVTFTVWRSNDAGAGNRYEQTLYRTMIASTCYEIATTLHYASDWTDVDQQAINDSISSANEVFQQFTASLTITL
jgi:hypothetical protein